MPGKWFHADDPEYLATRPDDRVSYSVLHSLSRQCEHKALHKHRNPTEATDAMRFGSLVDVLLLEPELENERIKVCPGVGASGVWSAKYKAETIAPLEAQGLICVKEKELQPARDCVNAIMQYEGGWIAQQFNLGEPDNRDPDRDTRFQQRSWFNERRQAVSLRVDAIEFDPEGLCRWIMDLKLTNDPSPRGFLNTCDRLGYDMQAAVYLRATKHVSNSPGDFYWLAVGSEPPYTPSVYHMSKKYQKFALAEYLMAVEKWHDVKNMPLDQAAGFNGHKQIATLDLPHWR